jgi:hypothetical protein
MCLEIGRQKRTRSIPSGEELLKDKTLERLCSRLRSQDKYKQEFADRRSVYSEDVKKRFPGTPII